MNNTIEIIKGRRSVKHFDPNHKLTNEEKEVLYYSLLSCPTAFNIQNWRFVVVEDAELREKIKEVSWNQAQVTDASMLFIFCADLKSWEKDPSRYWQNAPKEVQDFMIPAIDSYYRNKEDVQRDEAMRSCGIAAATLMISAKSLGYDSCPMDGFDFEAVGKLINLPEDHIISMFVVIGKATQEARPKGGQLPISEVIINNKF